MAAAIANLATSKKVLISGVTGFIGTAVALEFLSNGYTVHATARSQEKADAWLNDHYIAKANTKFFIVKDSVDKGAFDEAIKGVDVVAHTASPFHMNAKDPEKDMLIPAIDGTKSILESAAKEASVKRVVITSSFASILDFEKENGGIGYTYSHADWNPATYEKAKKSDNPGYLYCASKVLAEKAAWDFVKQNNPSWALSTVCPPLVLGPPHQHIESMDSLNTSSASIWTLISGDSKEVPPTNFPVGTDVRDVAKAHYLAATVEEAKGQRYLTIAFHFSNDQAAALLRKEYPDRASRIPSTDGKAPPEHFGTDSSKAEKELGLKWIGFEQSVKDTADRLWQIEEGLKSQK